MKSFISRSSITSTFLALTTMGIIVNPAYAVTELEVVQPGSIGETVAQIGGSQLNCSGVAISPSWILTNNKCVSNYDYDTVPVTLGAQKELGEYKGKVYSHPNVDLALLNIDRTHNGPYAQLPTSFPNVGITGQTVGFGSINQQPLDEARYSIVQILQNKYNKRPDYRGRTENTMYISSQSTLGKVQRGDYGAPLFIDEELHGIFTHGFYSDGQYLRMEAVTLADNIDWINKTTGINHLSREQLALNTSTGDNEVSATPGTQYEMKKLTPGYISSFITDNGTSTSKIENPTPITPEQPEIPQEELPKQLSFSSSLSS